MCPERYFWSLSFNKRRLQHQSTMVTTGAKLVISLLFVGALYTTDATIAWTSPDSSSAADFTTTLSLGEDQALNTEIESYVATGTAPVTYALTPAVSPFALTSLGSLTITAALDFETTKSYTLTIVATDSDPTTGTVTVTVTVTDVANEHDPVFAPASYSPCIVDKSTADTTLTTVSATDQDTSETITYAIDSGNTNTDFKIDTSSGLIQVNAAKTLDKATTPTYTLVVSAVDSGTTKRTGTTTVSVTVDDVCDSGTAVAVSMMMLIASLCMTLF